MSSLTVARGAGPFLVLVRAGFRQQSQYRLAMLAGLATNCVFGFIRAALLLSAQESATGPFAGYTRETLAAYVWISQALLGSVVLMSSSDVADRIKNGDVAIDFLRPVPVLLSHTSLALGRGLYSLVPRGVPAISMGLLTTGFFLPTTPGPYLLGVVSVVVAIVASYVGLHCVSLAGFWLVESRGLFGLYGLLGTFLAGLFVPVDLFPGWLRTLAACTPFPTFLQYPVDVLSGRVLGWDAVGHLAVQVGWLVALVALAQLLTAAGRRRLEVQGG